MQTKGIILSGGAGTRLYPLTAVSSKQLQAVYDKPMIYYPLATLMLANIKDVLIITTPQDLPLFKKLLSDGSSWGINIKYSIQEKPKGIAEAFLIAEEFIGNSQVCLLLGDNVIYGKLDFLRNSLFDNQGGTVFAYPVENPSQYGVVEFDKNDNNKIISIEEKPTQPKSNFAIPGIYVFDSDVAKYAKNIIPSQRGELEITDLLIAYVNDDKLNVKQLGRGIAWFDTGTPEDLLEAANFIHTIEKRQGLKIACLEEIAYYMKFINKEKFDETVSKLPNGKYKDYCISIF